MDFHRSVPAERETFDYVARRIEGAGADRELSQLEAECVRLGAPYFVAEVPPVGAVPVVVLNIPRQHPVATWLTKRTRAPVSSALVLASRGQVEHVHLRVNPGEPSQFGVCLSQLEGLLERAVRAGALALALPDQLGRPDLSHVVAVPVDAGLLRVMRSRHAEMLGN